MTQLTTHHTRASGVFSGLVFGLLAGAATALLLAPHSGKETRKQIQHKSIELRDQATGMVQDTVSQVRSKMKAITTSSVKQMKAFQRHGKEIAFEKLEQISEAVR